MSVHWGHESRRIVEVLSFRLSVYAKANLEHLNPQVVELDRAVVKDGLYIWKHGPSGILYDSTLSNLNPELGTLISGFCLILVPMIRKLYYLL